MKLRSESTIKASKFKLNIRSATILKTAREYSSFRSRIIQVQKSMRSSKCTKFKNL